MKLRKANNNFRVKHRKKVYLEALRFHEKRAIRLMSSGRSDKLRDTGFLRRLKRIRRELKGREKLHAQQ